MSTLIEYEIPTSWTWTRIGEIAHVEKEHVEPKETPNTEFNYLSIENIESETGNLVKFKPTKGKEIGSSKLKFTTKDILYSKLRPYLNKVHIPAFSGVSATDLIPLRPEGNVSREYLAYYLRIQRIVEYLNSRVHGIQLPRVSVDDILGTPIPLIPLEEQKRIVSKIDELVRESIAACKALDKVPQIMKRFRQSVLISAFGGKLIKSSGWRLVKLRDIVENLQPGFACGKRDENGFIQLRMNNIGLNGKIITTSFLRVPKSETNIQKYKLHKGDIIFNNTNSPELVGKTVIFNDEIEDCVYSNHLTRIRIKPDLTLPEFVTNFLMLEQKKGTFELLCRRFVGQAAVPRESLLNLDFPLPSLEEQKQIILKVEELFSFANQIGNSVREAKERSDKIDQSILTKAFRGELVPQNSNDEPASVLLEQIKSKREKELEIKTSKRKAIKSTR